MNEKRETLNLTDLQPKVRCSLEEYLQHREQMRGHLSVVGIKLSDVSVAFETVEQREAPPDEPDAPHRAGAKEEGVGWECSRPLFPPEDSDDTPWGV